MPDLDFSVTGVGAGARGLTPLMQFHLEIKAAAPGQVVQAMMLSTQIQIQSLARSYNADEKERLSELFGTPDRWGHTLRNQLWTHVNTNVRTFTGRTEITLPVPCTYDLNVSSGKYFNALEAGDVSLLFLFSGTVFYLAPDGRLQVEQVSWNKECAFRMPVKSWRDLMQQHFPNSAWIYLQRDVFDRLYQFKRQQGLNTWEEVVTRLLPAAESAEALA